jgi:hypothetical protein
MTALTAGKVGVDGGTRQRKTRRHVAYDGDKCRPV